MLMELRLRSSESTNEVVLVSLAAVFDGCAVKSMLVAVVVVVTGFTLVTATGCSSVPTWLGRHLSSGISTTDSATDSDSLSGVSANAANGLGVPIVDAAVGVTTFGVPFITPVAGCVELLYISYGYAKE